MRRTVRGRGARGFVEARCGEFAQRTEHNGDIVTECACGKQHTAKRHELLYGERKWFEHHLSAWMAKHQQAESPLLSMRRSSE